MAIRNGIFKIRNTATGEKDEVMLKTTVEQVKGLDKMTGATASAAGTWGLAPAPPKGSQNLALCGGAEYKVLPIEGGGTGANTIAAAVKALFGETAVGSDIKPMYYDGAKLQACADSIGGGGIVAALLEQNGYVKFANGLILQWGYYLESTYSTDYRYYPIAFTRCCTVFTSKSYMDTAEPYKNVSWTYMVNLSSFTCGIGDNYVGSTYMPIFAIGV